MHGLQKYSRYIFLTGFMIFFLTLCPQVIKVQQRVQ